LPRRRLKAGAIGLLGSTPRIAASAELDFSGRATVHGPVLDMFSDTADPRPSLLEWCILLGAVY